MSVDWWTFFNSLRGWRPSRTSKLQPSCSTIHLLSLPQNVERFKSLTTGCSAVTVMTPRFWSVLWWCKESTSSAARVRPMPRIYLHILDVVELGPYGHALVCSCVKAADVYGRTVITFISLDELDFFGLQPVWMQGDCHGAFQAQGTSLLGSCMSTRLWSKYMKEWTALNPSCETCIDMAETLSHARLQVHKSQWSHVWCSAWEIGRAYGSALCHLHLLRFCKML